MYASKAGSSWNTQTIAQNVSDAYYSFFDSNTNFLVLDSTGNPQVIFVDGGSLKYATLKSTEWKIQTVDTHCVNLGFNSPVIDSKGHLHMCYWTKQYNPQMCFLKYAYFNGVNWQIQTIDQDTHGLHAPISLALSSSENPNILYWISQKAPAAEGDSNQYLTDVLKYANWTGSNWNIQNITSTTNYDNCKLALDKNGNPHVCYIDQKSGALKYASLTDSTWNTQTVEQNRVSDDDGIYRYISEYSVIIDSNGNPHISYISPVNKTKGNWWQSDLKFASRENATWIIESLEQAGLVYTTSLIVDATGNPHISYFYRYLQKYHTPTDEVVLIPSECVLKYASYGPPGATIFTNRLFIATIVLGILLLSVTVVLFFKKKRTKRIENK
jgi:hypothetical protein